MKKLKCIVIILFMQLTGCVMKHTLNIDSSKQTVDNKYYTASITADDCLYAWGCKSFNLSITNKEIELNWDKTYYIENGQTSGFFIFKGVRFEDKNKPKPSDIIFSKNTFSKKIWPSKLTYLDTPEIKHKFMPIKENGVYLTLNVRGQERNERLLVSFSVTKEKY